MMTRKDYIATASILESMKNEMTENAHFTLVDMFAEMMQTDNPRFDAKRFFAACGSSL